MCAEPVRHAGGGRSRGSAPERPPIWRTTGGVTLIVAGCLLGIGLLVSVLGKNPAPEVGQPDPVVRPVPPRKAQTVVISAGRLLREFRDNPDADQKYRSKELEITGIVERSGRDGTDTPFVILHAGDEGARLKIECFFDAADQQDERRIEQLSMGQEVTVRGEYEGRVSNLQIRECVLLK